MSTDAVRVAQETEGDFRRLLLDRIRDGGAAGEAVTIRLVDPKDHPDVPRCQCEVCKAGYSFMAFGLEKGRLSPIQVKVIIPASNNHF